VTLKPDGTDTVLASDFATGVKRRAEAFAGGSVIVQVAGVESPPSPLQPPKPTKDITV